MCCHIGKWKAITQCQPCSVCNAAACLAAPVCLLLQGLLNTGYYVCTFLFFWCYVARVPTGQGIAASAKAFAAVMGAVWAGSQVTKGFRAAVALAIAPLVDRWMGTVQRALRLESKQAVSGGLLHGWLLLQMVGVISYADTALLAGVQVFAVFVACCFSLAAALFGMVVLAWR